MSTKKKKSQSSPSDAPKKATILREIRIEAQRDHEAKKGTFAITVRLPEDLYRLVTEEAAEAKLSKNEWVIRLIRKACSTPL